MQSALFKSVVRLYLTSKLLEEKKYPMYIKRVGQSEKIISS